MSNSQRWNPVAQIRHSRIARSRGQHKKIECPCCGRNLRHNNHWKAHSGPEEIRRLAHEIKN